tara:strand:+ start:455 stop:700 length:246 start_codon:yes stop_codon:yes gene_type:complete
MKAAVYAEYGGPEVLVMKDDVPIPTPSATQVLIKVAAAGINPVACKIRAGYIKDWPQTLPMIPGENPSSDTLRELVKHIST